MRRKLIISLTLTASLLCMLAVGVQAQRRQPPRAQPRGRQGPAPMSHGIAKALGDLRWGMQPRQVHEYFANKIRERYRVQLAKAPGTLEEDRIRHQMEDELHRFRESYVRFTGTRTGWDSSFLRGEFTQGNRESMMNFRDENSQNFYFFIDARLWKWYKAFDASVFEGQTFDQFEHAVEGRFGRGVERNATLDDGRQQHWLEWQDRTTRLRAIDQTRFYGFYCLVFEDKATLSRLPRLRTNTGPATASAQGGHALVDSVVLPENGGGSQGQDQNADVVDRITGRIRNRQDAPAKNRTGNTGTRPQGATPRTTSGSSTSGGSRGTSLDDL